MRLVARISKRYDMKSRNDVSEWLWHSYNCCYPIIEAAYFGRLDVVRYLHENGADIHVYDEDPLHKAIVNNHINIVKYLCHNGVNIHVCCNYAIRLAARKGNTEIVKYLNENGAILI